MPLGFFAAKRYGSAFDHASLVVSLIGISIPIFFLAIILKYIFAIRLGWLPSVGRISITIDAKHPTNFYILDAIITRDWATLWDVIKHLILPAIALGSIPLGDHHPDHARLGSRRPERGLRPHGRARRACAPQTVDRRHVLRNALLPVTTIIGLQTGLLLSGAVLTETVFAFPGWALAARRDLQPRLPGAPGRDPLPRGRASCLVNLVVDLSYAFINPRIRYS